MWQIVISVIISIVKNVVSKNKIVKNVYGLELLFGLWAAAKKKVAPDRKAIVID